MSREYQNFEILIDDVTLDEQMNVAGCTVRVLNTPSGVGNQNQKEPARLANPAQIARWARALGQRPGLDKAQRIELGQALADLLLPLGSRARHLFDASHNQTRNDAGLRLLLRLPNQMMPLPWEYMHIHHGPGDPDDSGHLALDARISIVRRETDDHPADDWFTQPGRRRVVVAMASPPPQNPLKSLPNEQRAIKRAFSKIPNLVDAVYLPEYGDKPVGEVGGATVTALNDALLPGAHIFHFGGHGKFEQGGQGQIFLTNEQNEELPLPAGWLAEMLQGKGIRLVVLNACETAERDNRMIWSSVAAAVIRARIPAVVAMQYTIEDTLATAFTNGFYQSLVAGFSLEEAVTIGRRYIRNQALYSSPDIRDWGAPVVYLGMACSAVFSPTQVAESRQAQTGVQIPGMRVTQIVTHAGGSAKIIGVEGHADMLSLDLQQIVKEITDHAQLIALKPGGVSDADEINARFAQIIEQIQTSTLDEEEKQLVSGKVKKIQAEVARGVEADAAKVSNELNKVGNNAPDIHQQVVGILTDPACAIPDGLRAIAG